MSLVKFIIRRLLLSIPVLFGAIAITFFLTNLLPGNPIVLLLGPHANPIVYHDLILKYGFNQPVYVRFLIYVKDLFTGDWGYSITIENGEAVWNLVMGVFPRTIELAILSTIFATALGIMSGTISATNRNKPKDTTIRSLSLLGVGMPVFWLALLCQLLFGYYLQILPVSDFLAPYITYKPITGSIIIDSFLTQNWSLLWNYAQHLLLPVICLGFITFGIITRQTRSSMLEVLEQDYIRTARAKGASEKNVIQTHALRNSLIPTTTIIGMDIAGLLGGAVLTETVFNFKGMGMLLVQSINLEDYFVINAIVFLMTLIFVIANLATDILYGVLDPRIRLE
jgi:peptide/nickel transport system permease protein